MSETAGAALPGWQGGLDAVSGGRVYGWAWDPAAPDRRLVIELFSAGEPMGSIVADLPREDLIEFGIGDGAHAFEFPLPAEHAGATFEEVTAVIAGSSVPLIRFREIEARPPDGLPLMSSLSHRMAVMESMVGQMAQVIRAVNDRCTAAEQASGTAPAALLDRLEEAARRSAATADRLDRLERDFRTAEATLVRVDALLKRLVADQAENKPRWWNFFRR